MVWRGPGKGPGLLGFSARYLPSVLTLHAYFSFMLTTCKVRTITRHNLVPMKY